MRAFDILNENDREDMIRDQVITLLTSAHANNIPDMTLDQLKHSLDASGMAVPNKWLEDTVKSVAVVKSVNKGRIELALDEPSEDQTEAPSKEHEDQTVKGMASKALKRRAG